MRFRTANIKLATLGFPTKMHKGTRCFVSRNKEAILETNSNGSLIAWQIKSILVP